MVGRALRIATFLAANMRPVYQGLAEYLGRRLGLTAELVVGGPVDQFARGEVDAGFICGLPYVQLARRSPSPVELLAAPVLAGARYGGRPVYFSDVIVRRESPFRSLTDLRGRSWSYNDVDSHSGYNLTRCRLVELGETDGFFGDVVCAGSHQRSIRLVATGEVDGSAIDSQVLAVELREHPELAAQVRVVEAFGPSPVQPVVAAARLPAALKAQLGDALLTVADDPMLAPCLARGFVERFVPVTDADYDPIRRMLARVEDAGFRTLR